MPDKLKGYIKIPSDIKPPRYEFSQKEQIHSK